MFTNSSQIFCDIFFTKKEKLQAAIFLYIKN